MLKQQVAELNLSNNKLTFTVSEKEKQINEITYSRSTHYAFEINNDNSNNKLII